MRALVWNDGIITRWMSFSLRFWWMAVVRAPHSALPCVHSTPLGREVVPDVYCTEPCRQGSGSSARQVSRIAVEAREGAVLVRPQIGRRLAAVGEVLRHRQPLDALGVGRDRLGQLRLRDGGNRIAVVGEVFQLRAGRARVGGDDDGAEPRAREPEEFHLRRVVEMDEHIVAGLDAAPAQAGRHAQHAVAELAVGPRLALAHERLPDQERVVAARLGAEVEQPVDVAAGKRIDDVPRVGGRCRHGCA